MIRNAKLTVDALNGSLKAYEFEEDKDHGVHYARISLEVTDKQVEPFVNEAIELSKNYDQAITVKYEFKDSFYTKKAWYSKDLEYYSPKPIYVSPEIQMDGEV